MAKRFADRLNIPIDGNPDLELYSKSGTLLTVGYTRVVIGGRGAYIEFEDSNIVKEAFTIPEKLLYRIDNNVCFYIEHRSIDASYVKLYHQKRLVSYADYKIGMYYISPLDLYMSNDVCAMS
jgi:hypothetical protein